MNNKKGFQIYVILNFMLSILAFLIAILTIVGLISNNWIIINALKQYLGLIIVFILFGFIELGLRPSYIETIINEKEIVIRTFSPNIRNGLRFILMLRYTKYLKELKISTHEYNDYKLKIDKFGFHRILILQKIDKNGISETSEINISLLGQKKYTQLILSIDRLRGKINLN